MKVSEALAQLKKVMEENKPLPSRNTIESLHESFSKQADRQLTAEEEGRLFIAQLDVILKNDEREKFFNQEFQRIEKEYKDHTAVVKQILAARNHESETPIFAATKFANTSMLERLLALGASADQMNYLGYTPLSLALKETPISSEKVKLLSSKSSAQTIEQQFAVLLELDAQSAVQGAKFILASGHKSTLLEELIESKLSEAAAEAAAKPQQPAGKSPLEEKQKTTLTFEEMQDLDIQFSWLAPAYFIPVDAVIKESKASLISSQNDASPFIALWDACKAEAKQNPVSGARAMVLFASLVTAMRMEHPIDAAKIIIIIATEASLTNRFKSDDLLKAVLPLLSLNDADKESLLKRLAWDSDNGARLKKIVDLFNRNSSQMMERLTSEFLNFRHFLSVTSSKEQNGKLLTDLINAMRPMEMPEALATLKILEMPRQPAVVISNPSPARIEMNDKIKKFRESLGTDDDRVLKPFELAELTFLKLEMTIKNFINDRDVWVVLSPFLSRIRSEYENDFLNEETANRIFAELIARLAQHHLLNGLIPAILPKIASIYPGRLGEYDSIWHALVAGGDAAAARAVRDHQKIAGSDNPFFLQGDLSTGISPYFMAAQQGKAAILEYLQDEQMARIKRSSLDQAVQEMGVMLMGHQNAGLPNDKGLENAFYTKFMELKDVQATVRTWHQDLKFFTLKRLLELKKANPSFAKDSVLNERIHVLSDELFNQEMKGTGFNKHYFLILEQAYSPQGFIDKCADFIEKYFKHLDQFDHQPENIDLLFNRIYYNRIYAQDIDDKSLHYDRLEPFIQDYFLDAVRRTDKSSDAAVRSIYTYYKTHPNFNIHKIAGAVCESVGRPEKNLPHFDRLMGFATFSGQKRASFTDVVKVRARELPVEIFGILNDLKDTIKKSPDIKSIASRKLTIKAEEKEVAKMPQLVQLWLACRQSAATLRGQNAMVIFRFICNAIELGDIKTAARLSMAAAMFLMEQRKDTPDDRTGIINQAFFQLLGLDSLQYVSPGEYISAFNVEHEFRKNQPRILDLLSNQYAEFKSFLNQQPGEKLIFDAIVKKIPLDTKDKAVVPKGEKTKAMLAQPATMFTQPSAPAGSTQQHGAANRAGPEKKGKGH